MPRRYVYALVRCVPDPRTGEFVNIGAIAGCAEVGDWALRQVSSERRAVKLAGAGALEAVHGFLARTQEAIEVQDLLINDDVESDHLTEDWLQQLYLNHRNTVQLAPPTPMLADTAEDALDLVFDRMIIDPVSQPRGYVTKHAVLAEVREAYRAADLSPGTLWPRSDIFVGANLHAAIDFAVANGRPVQLTQAWSFQRNGVGEVATQVKAWAYAIGRLRDGEPARLMVDDRVSDIPSNIDLQVVVAPPKTSDQGRVYEEAAQVFDELGASVTDFSDARGVGARALQLMHKH